MLERESNCARVAIWRFGSLGMRSLTAASLDRGYRPVRLRRVDVLLGQLRLSQSFVAEESCRMETTAHRLNESPVVFGRAQWYSGEPSGIRESPVAFGRA